MVEELTSVTTKLEITGGVVSEFNSARMMVSPLVVSSPSDAVSRRRYSPGPPNRNEQTA